MPKVSIIVPIYNVEEYLERCIESLINQNLKEIEIILIDDGSKDKSVEISKKYQQKYPEKIVFLEKENGAIEAVEVKNYDLKNHLNGLVKELKRQVSDRKLNLPDGSTQRIALVTKGRGYSKEFTDSVVETLQKNLFESYGGNIPVTVLG